MEVEDIMAFHRRAREQAEAQAKAARGKE